VSAGKDPALKSAPPGPVTRERPRPSIPIRCASCPRCSLRLAVLFTAAIPKKETRASYRNRYRHACASRSLTRPTGQPQPPFNIHRLAHSPSTRQASQATSKCVVVTVAWSAVRSAAGSSALLGSLGYIDGREKSSAIPSLLPFLFFPSSLSSFSIPLVPAVDWLAVTLFPFLPFAIDRPFVVLGLVRICSSAVVVDNNLTLSNRSTFGFCRRIRTHDALFFFPLLISGSICVVSCPSGSPSSSSSSFSCSFRSCLLPITRSWQR